MAQINLLKQSGGSRKSWQSLPKILARLALALLIAVAAYYVWLAVSYGQTDKAIQTAQQKIQADQQSALDLSQRNEVLTRQLQLKNLNDLISQHVYFSQLLPALADATLKTASYTSLQVNSDNSLTLAARVPTLGDLDKYLQVFDLPEFYKNFSNLRIGGFSKSKDPQTNGTSLTFEVKMDYSPKLIQYTNQSN